MREPMFRYGPFARGSYLGLIAATLPVTLGAPQYFFHYLLFLLFLGFGLRPLLVHSGLYEFWNASAARLRRRWDRKFLQRRRADIERKARDEKYRRSHARDPRLPKNW